MVNLHDPANERSIGALYQLIYLSRARPCPAEQRARIMSDILAVSTRRNERARVTGALLFCDGWYLQALEGNRYDVEAIYDSISKDERHDSIRLLRASPAPAREFAQWSMCGSALSPNDALIVRGLERTDGFDPSRLTEHSALSLLTAVCDRQMPARRLLAI